jgi:hypothetical protein
MGQDYWNFLLQFLTLLSAIVGTIFILLCITKLLIPSATKDNLIDIIKWSAVSIAIVLVASIFENNLKDREIGLNEIKQYDKYVDLVVVRNDIGEKWRLSQYLSKVTASDKLRTRWEEYFKIVDKEYHDTLELRKVFEKKKDSLEKIIKHKPNDTINLTKIKHYKDRIAKLTKGLDTKVTLQANTVDIVINIGDSEFQAGELVVVYVDNKITFQQKLKTENLQIKIPVGSSSIIKVIYKGKEQSQSYDHRDPPLFPLFFSF